MTTITDWLLNFAVTSPFSMKCLLEIRICCRSCIHFWSKSLPLIHCYYHFLAKRLKHWFKKSLKWYVDTVIFGNKLNEQYLWCCLSLYRIGLLTNRCVYRCWSLLNRGETSLIAYSSTLERPLSWISSTAWWQQSRKKVEAVYTSGLYRSRSSRS